MKNVTITLDARNRRMGPAGRRRQGISVSRFVGELLQKQRRDGAAYEDAMRRFLSKPPVALGAPGEKIPDAGGGP